MNGQWLRRYEITTYGLLGSRLSREAHKASKLAGYYA
jgi:hypothetical protein